MSRKRHLVATVITLSVVHTAHAQDEPDEQPVDEQAEAQQDEPKDQQPDKDEKQKDDTKDEKKDDKKDDKKDKKKSDKPAELLPEVGGYVQLTYQRNFDTDDDGDTDDDELRVRRVRVKVKGKIIPKVRYNVEINPGSDDTAGLLRDAYLELRHLPKQDILIGQQKTQFGYESLESSTKLYVINRSEVSDALGHGVSTRDIGVSLVGDIPLPSGFSIEDGFSLVNGAGQNTRETTSRKNVFGRVGGRFEHAGLGVDARLGVSGGYGDRFDDGDELDPLDDRTYVFRHFGMDLRVDYTYAFVAAEWITGRDRDIATDVELDRSGWYVLAAGKTPWKTGPVVRFDRFEDEQQWTFGGYWGERDATVRVMAQFEHRKDKDDRLILWTTGKF